MKLPDAFEGPRRVDLPSQGWSEKLGKAIAAYAFLVMLLAVWHVIRSIPNDFRSMFGTLHAVDCGENLDCVKAAIGQNVQAACLREARQMARLRDFTRYATGPESMGVIWKEGRPGVATLRQENVNLLNNSGALTGFSYECDVDPAAGKIVDLRLDPL